MVRRRRNEPFFVTGNDRFVAIIEAVGLLVGKYCTQAGHRLVGPLLDDITLNQHATGKIDIQFLPDSPHGPRDFCATDRVGLTLAGKDADAELVARKGIHLEPPLVVGAELSNKPGRLRKLARTAITA